MKKMFLIVLRFVTFAAIFFAVRPAFAHGLGQDPLPPGGVDWSFVSQVVIGILLSAVLIYAISLGAERGTEVVKVVVRLLAKLPLLSRLEPTGQISSVLALAVAVATFFGFDLNVFSAIPIFDSVDPELVKLLGVLVVWGLSGVLHNQGLFTSPRGDVPKTA